MWLLFTSTLLFSQPLELAPPLPQSSNTLVSATPYDIRLTPHIVATASLWSFLAIYQGIVRPTLQGGLRCRKKLDNGRCDSSSLLALDRWVVGRKSHAWELTSDAIATSYMGLVAIGVGLDAFLAPSNTRLRDFITDAVIITEATAIATLSAHVFKAAWRRPRPTEYAKVGSIATVEHQLSFPSGHATSVAAVATASAMTFWLRHPESPWRWAVIAGAGTATILVGTARTLSGMHFPTDILAGMILGGSVGFLIPYTFQKQHEIKVAPILAQDGSRLLALSGSF